MLRVIRSSNSSAVTRSILFRSMTSSEHHILINERAHCRTVTLNRPKALNALNVDMCATKKKHLHQWMQPDSRVGLFIMKGAGEKAFCAGGDVRSIWQKIHDKQSLNDICNFFKVEYQMNFMLAKSTIPQVSIWNGIVMGGGVGISRLGEFRIATERAMFAMPETDVGSSFWLPHLPDGLGEYIGLTGVRLGAADLILSGIATHYVPSDRIAELEEALAHCPATGEEAKLFAKATIEQFAERSAALDHTSVIRKNAASIRKCFTHMPTMVHIMHALELKATKDSEAGKWAQATLEALHKFSPTSLALTLEMIHAGRRQSDIGDCLKMEYRIVRRCMESPDFYEGVRALLVDKDNKPKWTPSRVEDVMPIATAKYFSRLPDRADEISFSL